MFGTNYFTGVSDESGVIICFLSAGVSELSSRLDSKLLTLFWSLLLAFVSIRSRDPPEKVKEAIVGRRKHRPNLSLPKLSIWSTIQMKESTGELSRC